MMIKSSLVTAMPTTTSMKNHHNHSNYHPHQQHTSYNSSSASYSLPTITSSQQTHRFPSMHSSGASNHPSSSHHVHNITLHTTQHSNNTSTGPHHHHSQSSSSLATPASNTTNIDVMFKKIMEAKFSTTLNEIENTFNQYDSHLSSTLRNIEEEFREMLSSNNLKKRSRRGSSSQQDSSSPQDSVSTAARGGDFENDSNSADCSMSKKRKRSNFSKKDKELLIDWLHKHAEYPYPTDEEKEELLERVSMTKDQLETWFVNNRKRLLPSSTSRKTPAMLQCEQFNMKLEQKLGV
ncbi:hypothetical protein C9374_000920 [Naegleria lovaniensis]|uniref:Homeobox domain-containing protein n=1 Tax=Naegleria lovaniensis TaxID=51637 RepID=A0AA88GSH4_NAELO|nr:uncharacterized protein C9374_000920 [Naegleria lovaniensis]KAG2388070.1 hypothetical protein C9374_000920 [Naegleria lovaniensis]